MTMTDMPEWTEETLTFLERRDAYGTTATYIFKPLHPVSFEAGQYGHVRLVGVPDGEKAVREFSFASAPHEEEIWFGVDSRSESAYQRTLQALRRGDVVTLFKIKGHMQWPPSGVNDVVMIAGGVGITPFRSQVVDALYKKLPLSITLIHVSREGFLYEDELSTLPIEYVRTLRADFSAKLHGVIGGHPSAQYYVAGSPVFVESVMALLHESGIERISSDIFKGLSE